MDNTYFIKVVDPELGEHLASLGFQYIIDEQNVFAFQESEELLSVLQTQFNSSSSVLIFENKLRF